MRQGFQYLPLSCTYAFSNCNFTNQFFMFLIARNSFVKKSCTSNFSLVVLVHLVKLTILLQAQTKYDASKQSKLLC